ncbi:MAG TPA: cytochrome P450 [Alphaproteobacteria bacterium]|nr:cytochrome P450 [Alphaproteobacteria bacterium]
MPVTQTNRALRDAVSKIPLDQMDVSDPLLFQNDTIGEYFRRLRAEDPVHYCAKSPNGPYWSVTKFNDIVRVDTDHKTFSSDAARGGIVLGGLGVPTEASAMGGLEMFIAMDPPKHDAQRKVVSPVVGPNNLEALEPIIRERAAAILDSLPVGKEIDWVDKVSIELTTMTLATLFDFPWEERRKLTRWSDVLTASPGNGVDSWDQWQQELTECGLYFKNLWDQRVGGEQKHDLISMLAASPATANMPFHEFLGNLMLLIVGGNDTTRNSISGGVLALNENPAEYAKLMNNPGLIPSMVSEIIRWQSPITSMMRTALSDAEIGGKKIREGDKVVMWYLSGNRDDEVIERADEFLIDRKNPRQHLSFGFGIHRCVGNRVAVLQLRIIWEEIVKRFSKVEVVGEPVRSLSHVIHGFTKMPVKLHVR